MTHILKDLGNYNLGEILKIEFIEKENISIFPYVLNNQVEKSTIILKNGTTWNNFYFTPGTAKPDFVNQKNDAGDNWQLKLQFNHPKVTSEKNNLFNLLSNKDVVVLVTDINKNTLMVGTYEQPAMFTYKPYIAETPEGGNGYQCEFVAMQNHMAYSIT